MPVMISVYQAQVLASQNKENHVPYKNKDLDAFILSMYGRLVPCYVIVRDEHRNEIAVCRPVFVLGYEVPNLRKVQNAIADLAWGTELQGVFTFETNIKLITDIEDDTPIFYLREEYERVQNIKKLLKYEGSVTIH